MEFGKAFFKCLAVFLPCYVVYSGYRLAIERQVGLPQHINVYVVQQV
jgi:hypothetical protein